MNFEISGILHKKYDIESKSPSFQTREFVITTQDGNFQQFIKFQLVQDRCNVIDRVEEGETIKVSFDLRGREWQGKYFTNLNAWRVDKVSLDQGNASDHIPPPPIPPVPEDGNDDDFDMNSLPF